MNTVMHTVAANTTELSPGELSNLAVGAAMQPSQGDWSFRQMWKYLPNYYAISSSDYTDSGFEIMGYIHKKDAALMAAAKVMLAALKQASDELEDHIDADDGIPNWAMRLKTEIDEAIVKAGA